MHPHVKKLLELQKVDQDISSLTKDIDALPAEEAKRKRKLDELEYITHFEKPATAPSTASKTLRRIA